MEHLLLLKILATYDGRLIIRVLKSADERFDAGSFIRFLHEQLLPAMNVFNG